MTTKIPVALGLLSLAALGSISGAQIPGTEREPPPTQQDARGLLTAARLTCKFGLSGGRTFELVFVFKNPGSNPTFRRHFYGTYDPTDEESSGEIVDDRQDGNSRRFLVRFKTKWEMDFTLTGDRIVSSTPRRGDRVGSTKIEGTCA